MIHCGRQGMPRASYIHDWTLMGCTEIMAYNVMHGCIHGYSYLPASACCRHPAPPAAHPALSVRWASAWAALGACRACLHRHRPRRCCTRRRGRGHLGLMSRRLSMISQTPRGPAPLTPVPLQAAMQFCQQSAWTLSASRRYSLKTSFHPHQSGARIPIIHSKKTAQATCPGRVLLHCI